MKVSGFTIIRNAIKFDYPAEESIRSILPVVDEMVVSVGNSEDETLELIRSIDSPKIRIIESVWDDSLRQKGKVLAIETNKALRAISPDSDWAFYIQSDEVLHEKYHSAVRESMAANLDNQEVDGLLFDYLHFYGSYDYIGDSVKWYPREIRIVRNRQNIYSFGDAQGFRKDNEKKLKVKPANGTIYHYGWVRPPDRMKLKQKEFHKFWHSGKELEKKMAEAENFDYTGIDVLKKFEGTHPQVMRDRIARKNWQFDHDLSRNRYSLKNRLKKIGKKLFGESFADAKNYILLK